MTHEIHSTRAYYSTSESRFDKKGFEKRLGRSQKQYKRRPSIGAKTKFEFMSNKNLQGRSQKMLRQLLKDNRKPITESDILGSVLDANFGKKFLLKKRADQRKCLAIGCAIYHAIAASKDPEDAFERLKQSAGLNQLRTHEPCAIIVHSLVDYGDTKDEKRRNRQYAARDARALSYIVRKRMAPQEVEDPEKGETMTKWAQRESAYRVQQKLSHARPEKFEARSFSALKPGKQELSIIPTSEEHYATLKNWVKTGLLVFAPKDGRAALAAIVTPLTLTADQAKSNPDKVRAELLQALTNVKTPKQPPLVCDDDWD
jgi:hypothetical protein